MYNVEWCFYVLSICCLLIYVKMEKKCPNECFDKTNVNQNSFNKEFKHYETSTSNVKECFTEYTLEDKVEALKNVLSYNEKYKQDGPSHIKNIFNIKKTIGVKECLQANQETPFQTLISELRNSVTNSYWNKEVGKTRYQISNLPIGMNPLEITFGKKVKSESTVAELLNVNKNEILEQRIIEMYKKSHNSYLPAEQIKRHYKEPFNANLWFGKPNNVSIEGSRAKKLLTWSNDDSRVEEVRNVKDTHINIVSDKDKKEEVQELTNILNECPINTHEIAMQYTYLQYINGLRQKLKKRVPGIPFADIFEEFMHNDKGYTGILSEDEVLSTLAKYKIHVNEVFFMPLLDLLQIRKDKNVYYEELLNLLNWKYDFPTLPKIEKLPSECQYYNTTYSETIGNIKKMDTTSIRTAGIPSKIIDDKITAYSLLFPNIFTQYGLNPLDLSKLRSKEEIKSIFENIGVQFPNNNFDSLWEEELSKSGTTHLPIEAFKTLFGKYID